MIKTKFNRKRLEITFIYFIPAYVIFLLFSVFMVYDYSQKIQSMDQMIYGISLNEINKKNKNINNLENDAEYIYPKVSINKVLKVQNDDYNALLKKVLIMLFFVTLIFALFAYYYSGKSLRTLNEALKKQKRFVSDSSHEIKTPLTLIKTEAEVLLRSKKSTESEYKEFAKNVIEDINRLNKLVDDMLQMAKLDQLNAGNIIKRDKVNIKEMILSIVEKMSFKISEKNIVINVDDVENIIIKTIESKIYQLINIILDNAIKYSDESSEVKILVHKKNRWINISIINWGEEIPKKDIKNIFDRFYRVSKDRHVKGNGLGLSIAKEITDQLSGKIKIKSNDSKTVVDIYL